MSPPLLELRAVTRRYALPRQAMFDSRRMITAVEGISFTLERGQTLGIVGESGSGKSTLARLILALERPDAGQVLFFGQDLNQLSRRALRRLRPKLQMVFQDPYGSLDPRRTVGWSIAEPLRASGASDIPRRVAHALEQVGLRPADANRYPHEFSGGQRQRIAIARAIAGRPDLIVADEPVSALDVSVQAQILNLLMDLQDEMGLALVLISHDLAVVAWMSDQVLVMHKGQAVEMGPTATVLQSPQAHYTRMLLNAAGGME